MPDPITMGLIAATVIGTIAFAALAGLKGWRDWLDFKRLELASNGHAYGQGAYGQGHDLPLGPTGNRIELADLRERVRKLEAIAEGIDI